MPIDLAKVEQKAPELVSLAKNAQVSLQKRNLADHVARVALCLDISGSMRGHYSSGRVQKLAERVLGLGMHFDDNEAIDVFAFDTRAHEEGEMTLDNFRGYIGGVAKKVGGGTNYAPVMKAVREQYFGASAGGGRRGLFRRKSAPAAASGPEVPVYCMFVTDGEPFDGRDAERELQGSSHQAIFWQFMAIGDPNAFRFLQGLDDMGGRLVDNANFFAVPDPVAISDSDLYERMMGEYPDWLTAARGQGLIA